MKKYLKNEKGMALALVIMVLAILSVLGMSVLTVSMSENNFSTNEESNVEDYYVSKSALDAVSMDLVAQTLEDEGLDDIEVGDVLINENNFIDSGKHAQVTVVEKTSNNIKLMSRANGRSDQFLDVAIITSTATREQETTTTTTITTTTPMPSLFNEVIYAETSADFQAIKDPPDFVVGGKDYPMFSIPTVPDKTSSSTSTISMSGYYSDVVKSSITFETGSDPNNILNVVIDSVELNNNSIVVNGSGKVYLFVKEYLEGKNNINVVSGNPKQLIIFLGDPEEVEDENSKTGEAYIKADFVGYIYGPRADIQFQTGNSDFEGRIICDTFYGIANVTFIAAPAFSEAENLGNNVTVTTTETVNQITTETVEYNVYNFAKSKYTD
jgi:hypothetical protein